MNRLGGETSPYLLQHARNPVDWYPWGEEAFAKARAEDKPVLLSIGYAACHWCHVMERESFEDASTAATMNERFVSIKVDREERPDVDSIYMDAVQAMTGHGGWPMTMFLTADGVPFLGGTYFPPEDRHGIPSFRRVLEHVSELWRTRREDLLRQGNELVSRIAAMGSPAPSAEPLTRDLLSGAAAQIRANHDPVHGGFGRAPKFPQSPVLELNLRFGSLDEAMRLTLDRMALGGIYDQLGGGFARYSVDERWLVPHFEKMLYDNAQLARIYLHAWQRFGDPLYRRIATETLEYLVRDMRDPDGGFHSSEDADSEGEEGRFYVWSYDEVPPEARDYYGVTPDGNFEGRTILTAAGPVPPDELRAQLLERRSRRVRPGRDDKVLASWNGLVIAAFAEAGSAFGRPDLVDAARGAATFVLERMPGLHTWRAGRAHVAAMLEDHAYLADGLLELWHATFEARWLDACRALCDEALERYGDGGPGFYSTAADGERLIVRPKEIVESATPAPGAVLSIVLQKLGVLTGEARYARPAVDALRTARLYMERAPQAAATWLQALDLYLSAPVELAFAGDAARFRPVIGARYLPHRVLAGGGADLELLRDRSPLDGEPTAYLCERNVCRAPTADPDELARQLDARAV